MIFCPERIPILLEIKKKRNNITINTLLLFVILTQAVINTAREASEHKSWMLMMMMITNLFIMHLLHSLTTT